MALIAENAADRAQQLLLVTERLTAIITEETRRIDAREPPLDGEAADERQRLANAYRLEMARIRADRSMIESAPPALLDQLRTQTEALHLAFDRHEIALNGVKIVTEGLVQAMAEEIVRQQAGSANYGAGGAIEAPAGPTPTVLDRSA